MNVFVILLVCFFTFLLQAILGFFQLKNFSNSFMKMTKNGKVVVGKNPKKLRAGTILLLNIDKEANIMDAQLMQGRTIFARFNRFKPLENKNLIVVASSYDELSKFNPLTRQCILNAYKNYVDFKTGKLKPDNTNNSFFSLPVFDLWKNWLVTKFRLLKEKQSNL